jgi:hypothetical protein
LLVFIVGEAGNRDNQRNGRKGGPAGLFHETSSLGKIPIHPVRAVYQKCNVTKAG